MKALKNRLAVAEAKARGNGWDAVHRIQYDDGENDDEKAANRKAALDAYGREKIGPNDLLIEIVFVSPRWDADGNRIFQRPQQQPLQRGIRI